VFYDRCPLPHIRWKTVLSPGDQAVPNDPHYLSPMSGRELGQREPRQVFILDADKVPRKFTILYISCQRSQHEMEHP